MSMVPGSAPTGARPSGRICLSAPDVGPVEERYLLGALRSGWVAPVGPDLDAFEHELAERVGVRHAVAVSSGTAALHLALLALGVGTGDVVLVPTLTFAATANAVVYAGAEPVFVDCEDVAGNLDVGLVEALLATLRARGERIGAVIAVDLFGHCADYEALLPVCAGYGVPLVEDAAEALGSARHGNPAGSFGTAAVLSFNGNKVMTTSGGGALLSNDRDLVDRCRHLATQARRPVRHYEHTEVGYNYRLSNLLAALGRAQLIRLDAMIERRRRLRDSYRKLFAPVPGVRLLGADDPEANCWLTAIVVDPPVTGWPASELGRFLETHDIETRPIWNPMHRQPVFRAARAELTGAAERLFDRGLTLPSGSSLRTAHRDRVLATVQSFLDGR